MEAAIGAAVVSERARLGRMMDDQAVFEGVPSERARLGRMKDDRPVFVGEQF